MFQGKPDEIYEELPCALCPEDCEVPVGAAGGDNGISQARALLSVEF